MAVAFGIAPSLLGLNVVDVSFKSPPPLSK